MNRLKCLGKKKVSFIVIIILIITIISGCSKDDVIVVEDFTEDIRVEIINKSSMPSGDYYSLKVYNGSKYELKYLEVQLGFNINDEAKTDGLMGPVMFAGKAFDLPISINSGSEIKYQVFVPVGLLNQKYIDMDNAQIHLIGYRTKLEPANRFEMSGDITGFNKED